MIEKRTPGPWEFGSYDKPSGAHQECQYWVDSDGGDICDVVGLRHDGGCGQANAALIAAAPDLLEACLAAVAFLRHDPDCASIGSSTRACNCDRVKVGAQLMAAIAKAGG